jgi:AcrR family transcriptional regulator
MKPLGAGFFTEGNGRMAISLPDPDLPDLASSANKPLRKIYRRHTRERIIAAAQACFAETGYQTTNMEDVANIAGISRAAIYLHFKNKNELVEQMINDSLNAVREIYGHLPGDADINGAALSRWVEEFMAYYRNTRDRRIVLHQAQSADPKVREVQLNAAKEITGVILAKLGGPNLKASRALRTHARLAVVMTDAICYNWAVDASLSKKEMLFELESIYRRLHALCQAAVTKAKPVPKA